MFPFFRQEALSFYEQFRESNERLKERVFESRSAPLFDESFDEYPEVVEPAARSYEDAVAAAVQLIDNILPNRRKAGWPGRSYSSWAPWIGPPSLASCPGGEWLVGEI